MSALKNADPKKTGYFIRTLRKNRKLSQTQLGRKVFVTRKAVSKWETGGSIPSWDVLCRLAEYFEVSIPELVRGEYDKTRVLPPTENADKNANVIADSPSDNSIETTDEIPVDETTPTDSAPDTTTIPVTDSIPIPDSTPCPEPETPKEPEVTTVEEILEDSKDEPTETSEPEKTSVISELPEETLETPATPVVPENFNIFQNTWFKILCMIIALIVALLIGLCFIIGSTMDKIYLINYEDENFSIANGMIVLTKNRSYASLGNFYSNFTEVNESTAYEISLYYLDKDGNENYILKFNIENSQPLDYQVVNDLREILKDNQNNRFYIRVEFTDTNNKFRVFDLNIKIVESPKGNNTKTVNTPNKSSPPENDEVEDGINLNFIFEMTIDDIKIHFDGKVIYIDGIEYEINYDSKLEHITIASDNISISFSLVAKRLFFNTKESQTLIVSENNIVTTDDLNNINYRLLFDIIKELTKLI